MHSATRFRIRTPKVVFEAIDGEVLIINLETGHYYNLLDAGTDIWTAIHEGSTVGETVAIVAQRYDANPSEAEAGVRQLLDALEREALIIPASPEPGLTTTAGPPGTAVRPRIPAENPPVAVRRPFVPPRLEKYIDMEKLLLLDPVHEVDETGWPRTGLAP